MRVNIENGVNQIRRARTKSAINGNIWVVEELVKHLKEVRDRVMNGDNSAVDELFNLYTFSDDVKYTPMFKEATK